MATEKRTDMESTSTVMARVAPSRTRRGLIAGAAALAAGLLARQANDAPVLAIDGSAVVVGPNTFTAVTTTLTQTAATPAVPGFRVLTASGVATPDATLDAVQGFAAGANNSGIHGRNDTLNAIGATGVASNGTGVYGQSTSGTAVGASTTTGNAIVAQSGAGGIVVSAGTGTGIFATSNSLTGVYGQTSGAGQFGVIGVGAADSTFGLAGIANQNNSAAFAGATSNSTSYAASFAGKMLFNGQVSVTNFSADPATLAAQAMHVTGQFVVDNPANKSGALTHPDGTKRLVYCMESPESWVEDFGEAKLTNGTAKVTFDAEFLAVMNTSTYHVYLTEYDGHSGVYVTNRDKNGFLVKATDAAGANASFGWRVVVKGNGTEKAQRLGKFTPPKVDHLDLAKLQAALPKVAAVNSAALLPKRKP